MNQFTEEMAEPILAQVAEIEKIRAEIEALEKQTEKKVEAITTILWKEIADWKPYNDEMAVCFSPENKNAWYVWYVETWAEFYRFKETPSFDQNIRNYYRQEIAPQQGGDFIIIPVRIFEVLNRKLQINVSNKYELMQKSGW